MADSAQVPRPYLIRVHLYEARGLTGKDSSTTMSSGLAVVKLGPTARLRQETETRYNTVNASWDRTFLFQDVMLSDEEYQREKITLEVYERNTVLRNELIGSHEFSLDNIHRQKGHEIFRRWVQLTVPSNPALDQGYLLCSIYVLKDGDPTPTQHHDGDEGEHELLEEPDLTDQKKHMLNVLVYRATNLVPTRSFGSTVNPFVSVRFNGNTIQTQKLSDMANPIWNRKLEMPFHMPLDSDSIEVQVWNSVRARPDVLIGSVTFSYFQLRLTHRTHGPLWVPLYSSDYIPPDTTFLGTLMDSFTSTAARNSDTRSEFVGRVLLRLSVTPVAEHVNPRLSSLPCNPAIEPPGEQYVAHMVIYSGSEIPVQGGRLRVEMVLGPVRVSSKWVMGKDGVFNWRQVLDTIELYAPKDTSQCADLIINVYHKAGATSRKISFERIPVERLMPDRNSYWLNGDTRYRGPSQESAAWRPRWRTLHHVHADPKQSHIVAGFLLCTIGFGPQRLDPPPPRYLVSSASQFTLKLRVHQAGNLPAVDGEGSANPFVVIRFAGHTARLGTKQDTLFPFWYEKRAIHATVDKRHAPSVYLMVYHEGKLGHTLIGRAEVLTQDIVRSGPSPGRFCNRLMRVPLLADDHMRHSAESVAKADQRMPYLLLSMALEDFDERCREVVPASEEPDEELVSFLPYAKNKEEAFREYVLKMEALGLRRVLPFSYSAVKNPELELEVPSPLPGGTPERVTLPLPAPVGGSVHVMESVMIENILLPLANLHGVPLRVRLWGSGLTGRSLVGSLSVPVADFIFGNIERPPLYLAAPSAAEGDNADEVDDEAAAAAAGGARAAPGVSGSGEVEMDGDPSEDPAAGLGSDGAPVYVEGGPEAPPEESSALVDRFGRQKFSKEDGALDLDPRFANVSVVHRDTQSGLGDRNTNVARLSEQKKDEVGGEVELRDDYRKEEHVYRELELRRGAPQQAEPGVVVTDGAQGAEVSAVLKAFVRVGPAKDVKTSLESDDLLEPVRRFYGTPYVVRLYVFRGVNLTAREKRFSAGRQTVNSYLVVSNGRSSDNSFIDRSNFHRDDVNPNFYQVVELPAQLPDNNALELAVWDRDEFGPDELIGTTTIDLEWRLVHNLAARGPMEYRTLHRPGSHIAQGKVLLRLDLLAQEVARREKAEDLRAPQSLDYELRLVVWATRGVKLPELADRDRTIDQRIEVTTNFAGTPNGEVVKKTDTAFESTTGAEDFNHRMVWKVALPCKVPRLKITLWDERVRTDVGIGEVLYNLQPLFSRALREKQSRTRQREKWVALTHPNYRGTKLGEVCIELLVLTAAEAEQFPAGEAQDDPNRDPFLPAPHRNLPAWAIGSRGLNWMKQRQALLVCLCLFAVTLPFLIPFLMGKFKGSVL